MRGKEVEGLAPPAGTRITPAYAGKSVAGRASSVNPQDHPRLCGEKAVVLLHRWYQKGSPPPMRGKEDASLCGAKCREDHPRLCGEKCVHLHLPFALIGSPPPMRGKVDAALPEFLRFGITPAYAGKRSI